MQSYGLLLLLLTLSVPGGLKHTDTQLLSKISGIISVISLIIIITDQKNICLWKLTVVFCKVADIIYKGVRVNYIQNDIE